MYGASSSRAHALPTTPTHASSSIREGKTREARAVSVKALHVEGKVHEGATNVTLALFLLVSAPSQPPSQSYPLFSESNLVLRKSVVHPLTSQKVPFSYPPNADRLLRRARKVLHLQPPLKESYGEALAKLRGPISPALASPKRGAFTLGSGRASPDSGPSITGEIVVRDFMISLQMPKFIIPPSSQSYGSTRYGDDDGTSPFRAGRQTSFGASASSPRSTANLTGEREKRELFFVIAMELDVPLSGTPPNSPYMFILPLPRCLNNSIRLCMPTDSNLEENAEPTLEMMTIPQVQAQPLKSDSYSQHSESPLESTLQPLKRSSIQSQLSEKQRPRPHSHRRDSRASVEGYPADDELDGSSSEDTGVDERDPVIEGTFLSTDHLAVRWALRPTHAPPTPGVSLQGRSRSNSVRSNGRTSGVSSRARVAVDHVESSAKYTIFPMREIVRRPEDSRDTTIRTERLLPVALEYTARCVGFSHPGVATGVALEVALDEGSEGLGVDWDDVPAMDSSLGHSSDWTFSSSPGIIDWDWAPFNRSLDTRPSSHGSRQSDLSDREASYGYRSGLVREDTLLSEGSSMPSGSRRPLSRQFEPNGDSVTLEHNLAVNTSLMRAPLPNPALLDDTFDDERPASGHQPLSRESTGPSAMSVSQWSLASSRHSRTTASAASDSVGDLNGGPVSRTQTEIEYYPSSSSIPTMSLPDLEPTPPSNPILLDIDLHALLTSQKVPNPSMAQANFTFKGRILISLPESVEGGDISAALPMFRLPMARSHECKIYILPSPIISNRELTRPFGVRFEGGKKEVIDPVVQGEAVYTVKVASSLAKEGVVPITLVYPLPPAKGKVTSSSAINKGLQHSTAQAVSPSNATSMMSLNKRDPPSESRSSGQREPADELWMPSPFASTLTSPVPHVKQEPDQQQPNGVPLSHLPPHSPEDLAIAWVDLRVIPVPNSFPPRTSGHLKESHSTHNTVEYISHLRTTWPSHQSADFVHRNLRFELMDSSNNVGGNDEVVVQSASVGGRAADFHYQSSNSGTTCGRWVVVTLPSGGIPAGAVLDVVYTVRRNDVPRRAVKYNLLLPCFASAVARMNVTVLCPSGCSFSLLQSDIMHAPPASNTFQAFSLPPHTSHHMSFKIKRPSTTARLIPSLGMVFQFLLLIVAFSAAYHMTLVEEDMRELRLRGILPGRQSWYFPNLATILGNADLSSEISAQEAEPITDPSRPSTTSQTTLATTTLTVTTTRRLPTQTYAAPDNLWGEWETTTTDPFSPEASVESTGPDAETSSPSFAQQDVWPFLEPLAGLGLVDEEHRKQLLVGAKRLVHQISSGILAILKFTM